MNPLETAGFSLAKSKSEGVLAARVSKVSNDYH
jgi:hypothetical protein